MKKLLLPLFGLIFISPVYAQISDSPCSHSAISNRHLELNPEAVAEMEAKEHFIQQFIATNGGSAGAEDRTGSQYVIPVVMHVFHNGDDGKMGMDQALSGLEILNEDFNGFNDGWGSIDPAFDSLKSTLDITFCLATIDPFGNPTTGLIYHEDSLMMLNEGDLFQFAWDNYSYLNIYFPKYTTGGPSLFTAYAYYPSTFNTNNNTDGIFYSSIRWGYGAHSELTDPQDWASVCTHEAGHWLDLRHTFEGGCSDLDLVDDTPATTGGTIELSGCYNNDFSCGVATNGENFMDYNHDCKKMFTIGQVERMTAALYLPSRINLWDLDNLIATGCEAFYNSVDDLEFQIVSAVYPNPAQNEITFNFYEIPDQIEIVNFQGMTVAQLKPTSTEFTAKMGHLADGMYIFKAKSGDRIESGKFVLGN